MKVLSYGEDPLTYWVLTERLGEFLGQLGDTSPTDDALVFYRPSFGRAAGAQFGEFDAIVGTKLATYLVESKWHGSGEVSTGTVILRPEQQRRHEIFRWYREQWDAQGGHGWDKFLERAQAKWSSTYPDRKLAPAGSILATNLEFVLRQLQDCGPTVDVALYVGLSEYEAPVETELDNFKLVVIEYEGLDDTGYFELTVGGPR